MDNKVGNRKPLARRADRLFGHHDYLEAFLLQSCFIEGVVKILAGVCLGIAEKESTKMSVSKILDSLLSKNKIGLRSKNDLREYIQLRNKVVHDILTYDKRENDVTVKKMYQSGNTMLSELKNTVTGKIKLAIDKLQDDFESIVKLMENHE